MKQKETTMSPRKDFTTRRWLFLGLLLLVAFGVTAPAALAVPQDGVDPPLPTFTPPTATPVPTATPIPPQTSADLVVERVRYGANGSGGYYTEIRIRNQGNLFAGVFHVREQNVYTTNTRAVFGLSAGSFVDVRFDRNACHYRWNVIVVDPFNAVEEFSETNNVHLTFRLC
jgi:hypothetical protein